MQRLNNKQNGMTGLGIGVIVMVMGLFIVIGLKLIPIYIENITVVSALSSLEKRGDEVITLAGIKSRLLKNFDLNNIDSVKRKDITIKHLSNSRKEVTIAYEVRRSVMGNVDVVVKFSDSIELTNK